MHIDVFTANLDQAPDTAKAFGDWLDSRDAAPDFVALHESVDCLDARLQDMVRSETTFHGATSCLGVMGREGPKVNGGFGALSIWDPEGDYGSSLIKITDDPVEAARRATEQALIAADRPGEAPDLIWISASPGTEELILQGVEAVVGRNVPVLGGSAADNSVAGDWRVFDQNAVVEQGVLVSALFPSKPISFAYHNGYAPTECKGIVTASEGRLLKEIDGRPAAEVYREWTPAGTIPDKVTAHTAILSESTLSPFGRYLESVGDVPYYLLAHPAGLTSSDELELFADVAVGDQLTLMSGAPDQLTQRAGKVAALAALSANMPPTDIAGALIVYCGGCMLAVQDRLSDVTDGISSALPDVPYLGIFTFGEQGVVLDGRNRHGNLMISAVVFGA